MKKTVLIFFLLILCLFVFNQCKREKGKYLGKISFTAQDIAIIPYHGGESFVLVDSLGDSLHYHLAPKLFIDSVFYYNTNHFLNTQEDLNYEDYYWGERVTICDTENLFSIILVYSNPFFTPLEKYLDIDLRLPSHSEIPETRTNCKFNNGVLYQYSAGLYFQDSITLVNRKFYSVYSLSSIGLKSGNFTDNITFLYYNISQGIIGVRTGGGHTWRLD